MIKTITLQKIDSIKIAQFASLSTVAIGLPFFVHNQLITGSIINAMLILALMLLGIRSAVFLALFPSVVALSSGLLPALLAPIIPFIMISNILLIVTLDYAIKVFTKERVGFVSGVIIGSFVKFLFLYLSVNIIAELLIKKEMIVKVAQIMSSMQFFTALAGGVIALGVLGLMGKFNK